MRIDFGRGTSSAINIDADYQSWVLTIEIWKFQWCFWVGKRCEF